MLHGPPPADAGASKPDPTLSRALFGQVTGRTRRTAIPSGCTTGWTASRPASPCIAAMTAASTDGRPYVQDGALGGRAVFLDTGAGKGGHLSWIDLRW